MMLTPLPEEPFSEDAVRDWSTYEGNLSRTPLARKYLRGILKAWIENPKIDNPLAIPWLRSLARGGLLTVERYLSDFESDVGQANLAALIPDLFPPNESILHTLRRPSSLYGEIATYRELRKLGAESIKKIKSNGDWLADGHTVSVKTILDLDSNYQLIESAFEGLGWRAENPMIRRTKEFRAYNGTGLDNRFMTQILDFLHSDLEGLLSQLNVMTPYPRWFYAQMELMRDPATAATGEKRRFRVRASRFKGSEIHIELRGIGDSPPSVEARQLQLKLLLRHDTSTELWISNDFDAWSESGQGDFGKLLNWIRNRLNALSAQSAKGVNARFVGWVNVTVHPSHQAGIALDPNAIGNAVRDLIEDLNFPAVVCLYGGFELAHPLVLLSQSARDLFG